MLKILVPGAMLLLTQASVAGAESLRISVYAPAGTVNRYLATPEGREKAAAVMRRFKATRVFVEGRRGDQYVPPELLRGIRDDLQARGFQVSGGIATVPGKSFGVRADSGRYWLNYQAEKTQRDIARFFEENAPIFDDLIVDDFYATTDTSPESASARGNRSWSAYRMDLLVSLVDSMMLKPARAARPSVRLIIKYPQWYDRFHERGYDPPRMSALSEQTWVGTETRNPRTESYGYVQPIEGYMNYRWLAAIAGRKTGGAWFDHIDCTAQNFLDQAYQSVLAGAPELTLFNLGDLMQGHPGQPLLEKALPDLFDLAGKVRGRAARGIAYYKPPASDGEENYYLMDYLGMIGLPVVPQASYPDGFPVAVLGSHAAADVGLLDRMNRHLSAGATLVLTPALVRRLGRPGAELAGVQISDQPQPALATQAEPGRTTVLETPLEIDSGLQALSAKVLISAHSSGRRVPLLTTRKAGRGRVLVWNVRTFGSQDGSSLAPRPLGLPEIPQALADALRRPLLAPMKVRLSAPAKVSFYMLGDSHAFYNFRDEPVEIRMDGKRLRLAANALLWQ